MDISRTNMLNLEKVQILATKWILCSNESYRERSTNPKLLHFCLYAELPDLLHLISIMMGEYDNSKLRKAVANKLTFFSVELILSRIWFLEYAKATGST